jgi:predicted acetyltransferase
MSVEIRPAVADEMGDFVRVASLALAMEPATFKEMLPEWTLCAFEDDRLVTTYAAWPFTQRMNGRGLSVAGVTCVGTDPLFRRRGNLRAIITTDFRRRHDNAEPVAILWASLAAIYQRYGYGIVSRQQRYTIEPRYLQFAAPLDVPGQLRRSSEDEFPLLVNLYRRFREQRMGLLHRGRGMWEHNALEPAKPGGTRTIAIYEEQGEPLGYAVYRSGPGNATGPGPNHYLELLDLCWLTPAAYRAVWEHLSRFDLVREITWNKAPDDDYLPHTLLEPRMLSATLRDAILARIIDVDRAFAGRGYDAAGGIVFAIEDEICPWNAGGWALDVSGGTGELRRSTATPNFTAPASTLAQLLYGTLSASQAWRMGRLATDDPARLHTADTLLATAHRAWCPDNF